MKIILTTYEEVSGQAINFQKSEKFGGRNVTPNAKNCVGNNLGVQQVSGTGKYLDLPSMIGRSRKATFKYIKDRIWRKKLIFGVVGVFLKQGGRLLLNQSFSLFRLIS